MDSNLRREIIIDNYQNPMNKKTIDDNSYYKASTRSDSCIDNISLFVKIEDDRIVDIYFDGEACAITTSATSIMIKSLIGKKINDVKKIMNNYESMINEEDYDATLLGELVVYDETYKQPNRKKCALFPFETLKKILEEYEQR